ncbi:filamentous hemagglutinin N-terminal domain-containing protein [Bordetella sp. 15P40C-2]|nr:filamentous hemagglutinin N-terminal domain-containing protein [Bordetella sp. 15P40C-2]
MGSLAARSFLITTMAPSKTYTRRIVVVLLASHGWISAAAQPLPITADHSVEASAPVVGQQHGVPVIQIVAPSAGGVSHNRYEQFNVGPAGVILNNSGRSSQTQLAGQIAGNPMLKKAHASAILNEVTAANPSQLRGMLEVAGPRAHVILANPAGITCDQCGFLNASRATLTTGRPEIGPRGDLAFRMSSGTLRIEGEGLNGTQTDQVDLLARALVLNAGVWADKLNVVVGPARVQASSGKVQPLEATGEKPALALDATVLGGMYANSIRLVGTEAGVGVNIGGNLVALTGDLTLSPAGDVQVSPKVALTAKHKLAVHTPGQVTTREATLHGARVELSAGRLDNQQGSITSGSGITLKVQGDLQNRDGLLAASGVHSIRAANVLNRGGTIAGGQLNVTAQNTVDNRGGAMLADMALSVSSRKLNNSGTLSTSEAKTVVPASPPGTPGTISASSATGLSGHTVSLQIPQLDNNKGSIRAIADLKIDSDNLQNANGLMTAQGNVQITTRRLANRDGNVTAQQRLKLNARESHYLGWLHAGTDIDFTYAGSLTPGKNIIAGRDIKLTLGGDLVNKRQFGAVRDLRIQAQNVRNEKSGALLGGNHVRIDAAHLFDNAGLIDGKSPRVEAAQLKNTGRIYGDWINIVAGELANEKNGKSPAHIASRGNLNIAVGSATNRNNAVLYAKNKLRIGRHLDKALGVTGEADNVLNHAATIEAGGGILIAARQTRNENADFASEPVRVSSRRKVYFSPAGSTDMYDAATTWLCDKVTRACSHDPHWLNDDPERRLLLPSKKYPSSRYGPPFGYTPKRHGVGGVTSPIALSYTAGSPGRDGNRGRADQFLYPPDSPIWAIFGLEPPSALPSRAEYERRPRKRRGDIARYEDLPEYIAFKQRHQQLDGRIRAFNRDFLTRLVKDFTFYEVEEVVTQSKTIRSHPGRIVSPGPITLKGTVTNDKSQIASGGKLRVEGPAIQNIGATGWRTVTREGQATYTQARRSDRKAHRYHYAVTAENTPFDMPVGPLRSAMSQTVNVPARLDTNQLFGTLMAGRNTHLISQGDIHNSGTIGASQDTVMNARNIVNHSGGLIQAQRIDLIARENLSNLAARIQGGKVLLTAGQDVNLISAKGAHESTTTRGTHLAGASSVSANELTVRAGNDIHMLAAKVAVERDAQLQAGRDIRLDPATLEHHEIMANGKRHRHELSIEKAHGSAAQAKGNLALAAGQDVATQAAEVHAQGKLSIQAGRDVVIGTATDRGSAKDQHQEKRKGLISRKTQESVASSDWERAQASTLTGHEVEITAGRDVTVAGSNVGAGHDLAVSAGRNITIAPGKNRYDAQRIEKVRKSGVGATGGLSIGRSTQTHTLERANEEHVPSVLGSLTGNASLHSNQTIDMTAGRLLAPKGNLTLDSKYIEIGTARDTHFTKESFERKQSGVSMQISTPFFDAMQRVEQLSDTADRAAHPLMQGLAAATAGLTIADMVRDIRDRGSDPKANAIDKIGNVRVSIEVGKSKQSTTTVTEMSRAVGSVLAAGENVVIRAGDPDTAGSVHLHGSTVSADGDVTIVTEGDIRLQGERNTLDRKQISRASGAGVGFGASLGGSDTSMGVHTHAHRAAHAAAGAETEVVATRLTAGGTVTLKSGSDAVLSGARVNAHQVTAEVGGNLLIESLQDTSNYEGGGTQVGVNVAVGAGSVFGGASLSNTHVQGNFASVRDQSGIEAGDGGFDIKVQGNTHLKGGKIVSNAAAADEGRNQFSTGSLTSEDIENHSHAKAVGVAINTAGQSGTLGLAVAPGASQKHDKATSTTYSGISPATIKIQDQEAQRRLTGETAQRVLDALKRGVVTGADAAALEQTWDAEKLGAQVAAQAEIIAAFTDQATQSVKLYTQSKRAALRERIGQSTDKAEIEQLRRQISDLNTQERVVNVVIGALTGSTGISASHAVLSEAADRMREYTIADSKKFKGITDGETTLDNISGKSAGIRGDGFNTAGVRVDLDNLCGVANERCKVQFDVHGRPILGANGLPVLALNPQGMVQFDTEKAKLSLAEYLQTDHGKKMSGFTGGIQGAESTLGGMPYSPGSILDILHEGFGGTHDFIGGTLSGLYDAQGNARRGRSVTEKVVHEVWSGAALVPAAPFALAEVLPPEAWRLLDLMMELKK